MDKGVVPLAGTNGETTTQGKLHRIVAQLAKRRPLSDGVLCAGAQVWTGCLSVARSTRKTEQTLPSGAAC